MNKIKEIWKDIKYRLNWLFILVWSIIVNVIYIIENKYPIQDYLLWNFIWILLIGLVYLKIKLEEKGIIVEVNVEVDDVKPFIKEKSEDSYEKYISSINKQLDYYKQLSLKIPELEQISKMTYDEYLEQFKSNI